MPLHNELILKSPRVGILHSPGFNDSETVTNVLDQPNWFRADPEYVVLNSRLYPPHFLASFFEKRYCHYSQFIPKGDDPAWLQLYREVAEYVTHLLVFMSPHDEALSTFLNTIETPELKVKLVII